MGRAYMEGLMVDFLQWEAVGYIKNSASLFKMPETLAI